MPVAAICCLKAAKTAAVSVLAQLAASGVPHRFTFAAVYMAPEARLDGHVDLYREVVEMPRVFEWNIHALNKMQKFSESKISLANGKADNHVMWNGVANVAGALPVTPAGPGGPERGNRTTKVAPRPGAVSSSTDPPCAATRERAC